MPPPTPRLAESLVGLWRLISREDYDDAGVRRIDPVMGPHPIGMLGFGVDHFAAQFMNPDRGAAQVAPVVANNCVAVNGYDAYFGGYRVDQDAGTIEVEIQASVSSESIGKTFIRSARVQDGRLIIQLATATPEAVPITRTLTFVRA